MIHHRDTKDMKVASSFKREGKLHGLKKVHSQCLNLIKKINILSNLFLPLKSLTCNRQGSKGKVFVDKLGKNVL